jgi:nucleotide-binding universal stress UspA family protein
MTYANLMVHMEVGRPNAGLLEIAGSLASRFHSNVTGVAACQPDLLVYGTGDLPSNIMDEQREEIEKGMQSLEVQFQNALAKQTSNVTWRAATTYSSLSDYLALQARVADLFITGADREGSFFVAPRHVDLGDLILQIGRPVLLVPTSADSLKLDRAMLAWRDTREARLAALLALPLLKAAKQLFVVEIVPPGGSNDAYANLKEVRTWLGMHGITAEAIARVSDGDDASALNAIAEKHQIDLVVAGAYGHSRLRESVLGGVTRDLLLHPQRCTLLAH